MALHSSLIIGSPVNTVGSILEHTDCQRGNPCVRPFCASFTRPNQKALECEVKRGRWLQESRASDADYYTRALMDYEAETGTTFKLRHCWEILKDSPKWMQSELLKFTAKYRGGSKIYKSSGSSSFNTESGEASIHLNANVGYDDEDHVDGNRDGKSGERRTVSLFRDQMREVECREREPYDHLTRDARLAMEELRVEIKAKYNLAY
ncbi:ALP1-like protein [Tanacetum coccineum]